MGSFQGDFASMHTVADGIAANAGPAAQESNEEEQEEHITTPPGLGNRLKNRSYNQFLLRDYER